MPLFFKTVWKASLVLLSRYRFKRSSNFMPRPFSLLAWADVRIGFPRTLVRVDSMMAFFCSIHSFLCNCGDRMERLDRNLTSEGCKTLSTVKTLGKAWCAPYYKNTIPLFLYIIIIVPSGDYPFREMHPGGSLVLFLLLLLLLLY